MKKISLTPALLLFLCSCATPQVVTQITPEAPEGTFAMGREYIPLASGDIQVELGFDGIYEDQLVFDLVVINDSPESLTLQPHDFYYVLLDSPAADSSMTPPRMAIKPDKVLFNYDRLIEDKMGQKKANSFLGILETGMGLLANTAAYISTENPAYIADAIAFTFYKADQYVGQGKMIDSELEMISEEKGVVSEELFRPCEVAPGEGVSGYVFFPRHPDTEYYMFCFPVEQELFQFVYRQENVLVYH